MQYPNITRDQWSSYYSYVLVTVGAVIGLGNVFQFPEHVATGGAFFILCYLFCELFLVLPILLAEIIIGRRGRQNPVGAISILALEANVSKKYRFIGWLCFVILFLSVSYYAVSVAFPFSYLLNTLDGFLDTHYHIPPLPLDETLIKYPLKFGIYFFIFIFATIVVVYRGINKGLEGISKLIIPLIFLIFTVLAIYSCTIGNFKAALNALFFDRTTPFSFAIFASAFIYAFFKLNVGMGCMIVYGSYLPITVRLGTSTLLIVALDAVASLLAYFTIFPLALASWQPHVITFTAVNAQATMNLFFTTPRGGVISCLFFLATLLAAWMPTIATTEGVVLTLVERFGIRRQFAAIITGFAILVVGGLIILSYGAWSKILFINKLNLQSTIQDFSDTILTPVSALLISFFVGWRMKPEATFAELGFSKPIYKIWSILIRYVVPLTIVFLLFWG